MEFAPLLCCLLGIKPGEKMKSLEVEFKNEKIKNKVYLLALLPFFIMVLLFEILPLINIVIESFSKTGGGGFTLEHFTRIFSTRLYQQSIYNSLWISIFSAVCGIIIAF
ncbi:hypothetical protein SD457_03260 [Coprobacillaceae bacterium CR2/5/TPMF4]|nr:hypothetical protein SD457_03260 [Coprobacillaceae bacterium CR2/5/TPMF4]